MAARTSRPKSALAALTANEKTTRQVVYVR
jgi:hypothetical protein